MKMCGCQYCSVFLHHLLSSVFVQFLYSLRRRIGDNPLVPDFSKFIYLDKDNTSGGRLTKAFCEFNFTCSHFSCKFWNLAICQDSKGIFYQCSQQEYPGAMLCVLHADSNISYSIKFVVAKSNFYALLMLSSKGLCVAQVVSLISLLNRKVELFKVSSKSDQRDLLFLFISFLFLKIFLFLLFGLHFNVLLSQPALWPNFPIPPVGLVTGTQ